MRTNWKKALYFAARQAYNNEVIDSQMKDSLIAEGNEYMDEWDWIEQKVQEWILASNE